MTTQPNPTDNPPPSVAELDADAAAQWAFTVPFEGVIPHLYLDTRGNVTCGIGFLIVNSDALARYEWQPDVATAIGDFERVRVATPAQVARAYAPLCKARLTEATMRWHFDAHVTTTRAQLRPWLIDELPQPARVALIDMAFNLGVGGLNKYKKLRVAILARRWADAAAECSRRGIPQARNDATRDLFVSCGSVA